MCFQLTLSRGAGGGAPLRTHTVHGLLPRDGHCRRLSHLVWWVGLNFRGDPLLSRSVLQEMVGWALGLEWIWQGQPQERQWGAIHIRIWRALFQNAINAKFKKMSSSCHFAVYWTYSLLHQCFMPNRYISLFKMYCKMQFFSKPL